MLIGPKPKVASLKEYKKELEEYTEIDLKYFELKAKIEKEKDAETKCIVVYPINSKVVEMDLRLRHLALEKFDSLSYYSYIDRSSEERKDALILDRLQNVKMKYEIFKKAHAKERVKINGIKMILRNALLSIKNDNKKLFHAIEQGYGKRNEDVYTYYCPEHKRLVINQFNNNFMKGIILSHH